MPLFVYFFSPLGRPVGFGRAGVLFARAEPTRLAVSPKGIVYSV